MRTIYIIILSIILFPGQQVSAQGNSFVFSHLNENDGLSYNTVNCFLKDSRGTMWIGTFNGFNRFDGANFYSYNIRKGSNSMNSEVVQELCEDKNGNLWGCTSNGVFSYNVKKDSFVNYFFPGVEYPRFFFNILVDHQGRIWTTTFRDQLYLYNPEKDKFELAVKLGEHLDKPNEIFIAKNGLLEDEQGLGLWMSTTYGIVYYDFKRKSIRNYKTHPGDQLYQKTNASALCKGKGNNFWYIDNDHAKAICFSATSLKIINTINLKGNYDFSSAATTFVDNKSRLWVSTWNYKAYVIDIATGNITPLVHKPEDPRTIASGFFWGAYQDEDNTIWLGTTGGISRCNPEANFYKEYRLADYIPEMVNDPITKMEEDPQDHSFWVVTSKSLLIHVINEKKYKVYNLLQSKPNAKGDLPGWANHIYFQDNNLIIATYSGAWMLKKGSTQLIPYAGLPKGYENFKCSEIIFEKDEVYINDGRQVLHWNKKSNLTRIYKHESEASLPKDVTILSQIKLDKNNKLWAIADENHLAFLNDKQMFSRISMLSPDGKETGRIVGMEFDNKGKIWFPYHMKGLCQYDPASKKTITRNITNGLLTNRMQIMKLDQADRPWIMNYNKVSVYLPELDKFYNFKIPYSDHDVNYQNHFTRRRNGNLIGSINNEVVEFYQDKFFSKPTIAKPLISHISLPGREIPVLNNERIVLATKENTVRFRFGLLTDKKIFPYDIEYMLEGAENTWTVSSSINEALYNNLAPGKYRFRVKARGKNSVWETKEAVLQFTIKTPFYKTVWFLILIAVLISGILFFFYRFRLNKQKQILTLKTKSQQLEKEKTMVMYESLKQQLNPHFLFNSLTSLSGLIETDQRVAGNFLEQMSGIYRYILKNGDTETVFLKDEIEFVQLYINLQQTRFKKGLQVNIDIPEEYGHYKIAPVTLQNLIENAIKHNVIDTTSPLVIDIFIDGDYLVVKNNLQKKNVVETSNKKGLAQFTSLYRYLSDLPVVIEETKTSFEIKVPLI